MAPGAKSIESKGPLMKLDHECQDLLRSGIAITSVSQCVEELVLNSLDAGSTCVAVRIDLPCGRIQCVDNGCGMSKEKLDKVACRYSTSKCKNLEDITHNLGHYGYRGEALASIRSISAIFEIQTRSSTRTYTREFVNGNPKPVAEAQVQRPSTGTTVTIHDLFHRLPVRKKHLNVNLELEQIRQHMEGIALIHPWIAFSLRNDDTNQLILKSSKSNSVAGTFAQLFTSSKSRGLCDISNSLDDFEVKGYVSKEGHHNKNLQYVYVNGRLVLKSKVHRVVNWMISRSSIARKRHEVLGDNGSPTRLTSERFGIYVINITCPLSQYDITFDPRKTLVEFKSWGTLLRCLEKAVGDFLVREGLKSDKSEMYESPVLQKILDDGDTQEDRKEDDVDEENSSDSKYGANISTWQSVSNKHSIAVCRPRQFTSIRDLVKDTANDKQSSYSEDEANGRMSSLSHDAARNASDAEDVLLLSSDLNSDTQNDVSETAPGIRDKTFLSLEEASDELLGSIKLPSLSFKSRSSSSEQPSATHGAMIGSTLMRANRLSGYKSSEKSNSSSQTCRSSLQKFKRHLDKSPMSGSSEKKTRLPKEEALANLNVIKQKLNRKRTSGFETARKSDPFPSSLTKSLIGRTDEKHADSKGEMPVFHIPIDEDENMTSLDQVDDLAIPSTSGQSWMQLVSPTAKTESGAQKRFNGEELISPFPNFLVSGQLSADTCFARKRKTTLKPSYASKLSKISGYDGKNTSYIESSSHEFLSTGTLVQAAHDLNVSQFQCAKDTRANLHHKEIYQFQFDSEEGYSLPRKVYLDTFERSNSSTEKQFNRRSDHSSWQKSSKRQSYVPEMAVNYKPESDITAKLSYLESYECAKSNSTSYEKLPESCDMMPSLFSPQTACSLSATSSAVNKDLNYDEPVESELCFITKSSSLQRRDSGSEPNSKLNSRGNDNMLAEPFIETRSSVTSNEESTIAKTHNFKPVLLENPFKKQKPFVTNIPSSSSRRNDKRKSAEMVESREKYEDVKGTCYTDEKSVGENASESVVTESYHLLLPASDITKDAIVHDDKSEHFILNQDFRNQCDQAGSCDNIKLNTVVAGTSTSIKLTGDVKEAQTRQSENEMRKDDDNVIGDDSSNLSSPILKLPTFTSPPGCHLGTQGFNNFVEDYSQGFDLSWPCTRGFSVSVNEDCDADNCDSSSITDPCNTEKRRNSCDVDDHQIEKAITSTDMNIFTATKKASQINSEKASTGDRTTDLCTGAEYKVLLGDAPSSTEPKDTSDENIAITELQIDLADSLKGEERHVLTPVPSEKSDGDCVGPSKTRCSEHLNTVNVDSALSGADQMIVTEDGHLDLLSNPLISASEEFETKVPGSDVNVAIAHETVKADVSGCEGITIGAQSVFVEMNTSNHLLDSVPAVNEDAEDHTTTATTSNCSIVNERNSDDVEVTDAELLAMDAVPSTSVAKNVTKSDSTTLFVGPSWICKIDPVSGDKVYVNRITGYSSLKKPSLSTDDIQCINSKKLAISKSKTHKLLTDNAAVFLQQVQQQKVQRQSEKEEDVERIEEAGEIKDLVDLHLGNLDVESVAIKWRQGSAPHEYEKVGASGDGPPIMSADSVQNKPMQFESRLQYAIYPQRITKSMLNSVKVIGQLDNKFIACVMQKEDQLGSSSDLNSWLLVVIDQHAAHERVRLEQLRDDIYEEDDKSTLKSSELNPVLELTMLPEDVRLMTHNRKHLTSIGINFELDPGNQTCIKLTTLPQCFIDVKTSQLKEGRASVTASAIQIMLKKRLELLQTTGGVCFTLPMEVHHILCLEACHGAVKFGDALSLKECRLLVDNLYGCKLPFQCAHGRPSVMPLLDLEKLDCLSESAKKSNPRLKNLKLKVEEEKALEKLNLL